MVYVEGLTLCDSVGLQRFTHPTSVERRVPNAQLLSCMVKVKGWSQSWSWFIVKVTVVFKVTVKVNIMSI